MVVVLIANCSFLFNLMGFLVSFSYQTKHTPSFTEGGGGKERERERGRERGEGGREGGRERERREGGRERELRLVRTREPQHTCTHVFAGDVM